MSLACNIL